MVCDCDISWSYIAGILSKLQVIEWSVIVTFLGPGFQVPINKKVGKK